MAALFVGIDLDYTLLDTDAFFYDNVLLILCSMYPELVDRDTFIAHMDQFRQAYGPANEYDFFAQLASLGLDAAVVEAHITASLSGDQLLRPGVAAFLERQRRLGHDVQIITIGLERYQTLKQRCVPALAALPMRVIREPKGAYLARHVADRSGYMIDDKLLTDLPAAIKPLYVMSRKSEHLPSGAFRDFSQLLTAGPEDLNS